MCLQTHFRQPIPNYQNKDLDHKATSAVSNYEIQDARYAP